MNMIKVQVLRVGMMLATFAIVATTMVVITEANTHDIIIENERQTLLAAINALVAEHKYNNDILTDTLDVPSIKALNVDQPSTIYRARMDNHPIAAIFTSIAPNGYNGQIKLLVAIYFDGTLAGVRVINHKETPGLGDKINEKKSDWILNFKGLSLTRPVEAQWKVKKDGGYFDEFTGATITPRAVVSAVKNALHYFETHRDDLFEVAH